MCLLRSPDVVNDLEHSLQVNGLSPECVLRCLFRLPVAENDLEHSLQINGLSPEGVLRCLLRLPESEDDLKHSLQANGFSICSNCRSIVFCMLGPSLMNQNNFSFEVTNAVIASFCVLGDFVMILSYYSSMIGSVTGKGDE